MFLKYININLNNYLLCIKNKFIINIYTPISTFINK